MNVLQKEQVKQLDSISCSDLARKVNELVSEFNKLRKTESPDEILKRLRKRFSEDDDNLVSDETIVDVLWDADTKSDLRRILNDYLEV